MTKIGLNKPGKEKLALYRNYHYLQENTNINEHVIDIIRGSFL